MNRLASRTLVTADLHLTDNPRDEYRWGIFNWIRSQINTRDTVLLLGDITDAKDRHSAQLVNRLTKELYELKLACKALWIVPGNHDFVDEGNPFFKFIGLHDRIDVALEPTAIQLGNCYTLLLPCTRAPEEKWRDIEWSHYDLIFTHQTYDGAKSENGTALQGVSPSIFKGFGGKVWSGDIHVPQRVSKRIEYVGAPYRIRFGDEFSPRVVLLADDGSASNLHFRTTTRQVVVVTSPAELDDIKISKGDQVKVRVRLKRAELADWPNVRLKIERYAIARGFELCGLELLPVSASKRVTAESLLQQGGDEKALVREYAKKNKLDAQTGLSFLKD